MLCRKHYASKTLYNLCPGLMALLLSLAILSCQSSPTVIPAAKNLITGEVDGTEFSISEASGVLDSSGIYIISASINSDASLSLYFIDENVELHNVQEEGPFIGFIHQLDSLASLDPPVEDSLVLDSLITGLQDLLANSGDPLGMDRAFMFYVIGDFIYFSEYGEFRLTDFDDELNRISGELDIRLINFFGGGKRINAILDDIEFFE